MKTDNELIAEFMGLTVSMFGPVLYLSDEDGMIDFKNDAEPYWPDKNWNQLMPVVEKIQKLDKMVCINFFTEPDFPVVSKIYSWGIDDDLHNTEHESSTAIESVYNAVVFFIKWHNNQKK